MQPLQPGAGIEHAEEQTRCVVGGRASRQGMDVAAEKGGINAGQRLFREFGRGRDQRDLNAKFGSESGDGLATRLFDMRRNQHMEVAGGG
ncbi:hypothetical protein D3C85_1525270 [compost metagenome]